MDRAGEAARWVATLRVGQPGYGITIPYPGYGIALAYIYIHTHTHYIYICIYGVQLIGSNQGERTSPIALHADMQCMGQYM
jgi:hypothetical protein